jgi:hypothetical protein
MFVAQSTSFPPRNVEPVQEHQHLCSVATVKTAFAVPAGISSITVEHGSVRPQESSFEPKGIIRLSFKDTDIGYGELLGHANVSTQAHARASEHHDNGNRVCANWNLDPLCERKPHLFKSARGNNASSPTLVSFEAFGDREKNGRALWFKRFCDLIIFKQRHGKCRVPTQADTMQSSDLGGIGLSLNTKDGLSIRKAKEKQMQKRFGRHMVLGKWVAKQRHRMKKGVRALLGVCMCLRVCTWVAKHKQCVYVCMHTCVCESKTFAKRQQHGRLSTLSTMIVHGNDCIWQRLYMATIVYANDCICQRLYMAYIP